MAASLAVRRPSMERRYLSVQEASEVTGLSPWTWRTWAYAGKVASVKAGAAKSSRLLIPLAEVERVMSEGYRPAVAEVGA